MDIGEPQRVIVVEPLQMPIEPFPEPLDPGITPEPAPVEQPAQV